MGDQIEPHNLQIMASSKTKTFHFPVLVSMTKILPLFLVILPFWPPAKSNFLQMWYMLGCSTSYTQMQLTTFLDYGCYCGPGPYDNSKPKPKDAADRCCQKHDSCFSKYKIVEKCKDNPKYKSYAWQCINGRAICSYYANQSFCS